MIKFTNRFVWMLVSTLLLPAWIPAVEILEADSNVPSRFTGRDQTDEQFGSDAFQMPKENNYLLGSAWYEQSREVAVVFGFRLTDSFLREWKEQDLAHLLFSVIEFHEGDARRICPIHVERLATADSAEEAISRPPAKRLGNISKEELQENRLYSYPLRFDPTLKPGDLVWIGLDSTNPREKTNHNLIIAGDIASRPGGPPPILIVDTPDAASRTVHGMSLLQSLNRRFYAPENETQVPAIESAIPQWVNPFRTARKLETLEAFRQTLEHQLAKLPDCPLMVPDRFKGFHSSIKPAGETWEISFPVRGTQSSITLYPAVHRTAAGVIAYAFPKRFTITAIPYQGRSPVLITDWSATDFPLQSATPAIFPFKWGTYKEVHLTVHQGVPMSNGHAFALAEVSFPRRYDPIQIPLKTAPENSLEAPPYWSSTYATDGRTAFSLPTVSADSEEGTFRTNLQPPQTTHVIIRNSKPVQWSSFELYPTQHPDGLPPAGFPLSFQIEFSDQEDFSSILSVAQSAAITAPASAEQPYVFRFPTVRARCARITLRPHLTSPQDPLIQLEEITFNGGLPLRFKGLPMEKRIEGSPGTAALSDQIINGHDWYSPLKRTVNLLRRDVLGTELLRVKNTIKDLHRAHQNSVARIQAGAIVLAAALLGLIIVQQRRQAKRAQLRIRHRIQQDLHDEIGSKLSVISMITDYNKKDPELSESHRTEMADANHCARTAIASLAEVIWLTDKEILTLDQCFDVMKNRAEKMVCTMKLELDFPKKVPPFQLSYQAKRNLILLFTEALNNALKHSGADTICVNVQLNERHLTLSIGDNGKGFSPEAGYEGIGLKSMNARARKLGGQLEIISTPQQGTTIRFSGKL